MRKESVGAVLQVDAPVATAVFKVRGLGDEAHSHVVAMHKGFIFVVERRLPETVQQGLFCR
jgi:hypothetical protein